MIDLKAEPPLPVFVQVRDLTIRGVLAMFLRQVVVMPVSLLATIFLARLLQPEDFGIYGIASFWIYVIIGFRDQGFAAVLIQQKEEPSREEWNTIFVFQSLFVMVMGVILYLLAAPLTRFYQMDSRMLWVIRGLSLVLFMSLLGSVPNVILERRLAYNLIAKIDVAATVLFHLSAVILALFGFGVWSFIVGAITSELLRAVMLFATSSWRIGFSWQRNFLRSALRFGSFYQLGGLTSLLRDNIAPLLVGPLFGPVAVGYLKWAERTTYLTSQVFTQIVTRVSFPSFSRLQDRPEEIGRGVAKMLRYLMLVTVPLLAVTAVLIPWIIHFVFTDKWEPATIAFYLLTLRMLGGNITTPFIGVLNAMGQVTTSLKILTLWTVADWVLALILTPLMGFNGVAAAYALGVVLPIVWLMRKFRQVAPLDLNYAVGRPLFAGLLTAIITWMVGQTWITDLLSLIVVGLFGGVFYLLAMIVIERGRFLRELQQEARRIKGILTSKAGGTT